MSIAIPPSIGPIETATSWALAFATGTLTTSLAIIAIAAIGFQMMTGHLEVMRAGRTLIGLFVVLGSATIARSLLVISSESWREAPRQIAAPLSTRSTPVAVPATQAIVYDPYAGASVPKR